MRSAEIQQKIFDWAIEKGFDAPYGVITAEGVSSKGRKYKEVTFGRKRTLDACVEIYNEKFMILKVNQHKNQVFKSFTELQEALEVL